VHSTLEVEPCILRVEKASLGPSRSEKGVPVTSGQSETLANLGMDPVHLSSRDPLAQLSWDPMADELSRSAVYEPVASNAARAMFFVEPVPSAFDLVAEPGAGIRWDR
jgi:hypothetical protein